MEQKEDFVLLQKEKKEFKTIIQKFLFFEAENVSAQSLAGLVFGTNHFFYHKIIQWGEKINHQGVTEIHSAPAKIREAACKLAYLFWNVEHSFYDDLRYLRTSYSNYRISKSQLSFILTSCYDEESSLEKLRQLTSEQLKEELQAVYDLRDCEFTDATIDKVFSKIQSHLQENKGALLQKKRRNFMSINIDFKPLGSAAIEFQEKKEAVKKESVFSEFKSAKKELKKIVLEIFENKNISVDSLAGFFSMGKVRKKIIEWGKKVDHSGTENAESLPVFYKAVDKFYRVYDQVLKNEVYLVYRQARKDFKKVVLKQDTKALLKMERDELSKKLANPKINDSTVSKIFYLATKA